jgi:hypothetical protein
VIHQTHLTRPAGSDGAAANDWRAGEAPNWLGTGSDSQPAPTLAQPSWPGGSRPKSRDGDGGTPPQPALGDHRSAQPCEPVSEFALGAGAEPKSTASACLVSAKAGRHANLADRPGRSVRTAGTSFAAVPKSR